MNDTLNVESYLAGAFCVDQKTVKIAAQYLSADDFLVKPCAEIFEAAVDADRQGKLFDGYIAASALQGKMDAPRAFVSDCINLCSTTANVEEYAKLLRREADERDLREKIGIALTEESGEKLTETIAGICAEQIQRRPGNRMKPFSAVMDRTYMSLFQKADNRADTGYGKLDALLNGLWGGELIVIAARPAVGKSAFALSIAEHAARFGKTVQFYSLEMEDIEIGEREMARWTKSVTMGQIVRRGFEECEDERLVQELADASIATGHLPIYLDDSPNVKPSKIRAQALTQEGLGMIVVDYGGLMAPDRRQDSRNLELGSISRDLKNLAKELKIPIIMLAQLNRGVSETQKPSLRELRDSGELEQNANKVIFLWKTNAQNNEIGVSVAKNRKGVCDVVLMRFDGDHMRFYELEKRYEEPRYPARRGTQVYDE